MWHLAAECACLAAQPLSCRVLFGAVGFRVQGFWCKFKTAQESESVREGVCVREREREGLSEIESVCMCVCVCVRERERERERESESVGVCKRERERARREREKKKREREGDTAFRCRLPDSSAVTSRTADET